MPQFHFAIAPTQTSQTSRSTQTSQTSQTSIPLNNSPSSSQVAFALLACLLLMSIGQLLYRQHRRRVLRRQTEILERLWRSNSNEKII
jgi:hypothetical protein